MSKDDNPFGSEPSKNPFGDAPSTDAFGNPIASDAAFGSASEPVSQPSQQSQPAPQPDPDDPWRTTPAPPPTGQYSAPTPGRKAEGAVAALVLGILGLVFCPLAAPVAWALGRKAERLVDASGRTLGGRGEATAGKVLGIIGTALMVIGIVLIIVLIAVGASAIDENGGTTTTFEF